MSGVGEEKFGRLAEYWLEFEGVRWNDTPDRALALGHQGEIEVSAAG